MARKTPGVGYGRYSRLGKRDAEQLRTLDAQSETREQVADAHGIRLINSHEDHGRSGGSNDRPGLQAALGQIEAGDAKALVASRLSRLGRSVVGIHEIVSRVTEAGGYVVLGDLGKIDNGPTGKLMMTVLGAVAELELDLAREHSLDARAHAISQGIPIMARIPFGYKRPAKVLEVDEVRGPVVTEMFRRRAAGAAWSELAEYVEAETGQYLSPQTMQKMLRNRTYLGSVRSGSLVKDGAHDPLTDEETWQAAQSTRRLRESHHNSLLAGLMICSGCGRPMTFRQVHRPGKDPFPTYACQRTSKDGRCPRPVTVSAGLADEAVVESFLAWAAKQPGVVGDPRDAEELLDAEQAVTDAEAELAAFLASPIKGVVDEDAFRAAAAERQEAVAVARERRDDLRASRRVEQLYIEAVPLWPDLDRGERRKLIASALDRIVVHPASSGTARRPFDERSTIAWRAA